MNVHSNLIVDFPSRQRVGSTTTSTSSHISPSSHSPSTLTRPRVSFSEVIRVQTVPKLSKYQQDLWFTADEIKALALGTGATEVFKVVANPDRGATLMVKSGQRTMSLSFKDLDEYVGARATRGGLLPRGWQKVDGLDIQ